MTKFKFSYAELTANYDMEMIWGQQCLDEKIRLYTPKRPKNWITFIRDTQTNCDIDKYALHVNNVPQRISKTLNYMMGKQSNVKLIHDDKIFQMHVRKFQFG